MIVGYVATFVLMYSVAAYVESAVRVGLISAYVIAVGLGGAYVNGETTGEYVGAVTAVLLPVLAGRLVRHHREQTEQLRGLTAELAHERERTAQMAVADERVRIARELHDVVAHSHVGGGVGADRPGAVSVFESSTPRPPAPPSPPLRDQANRPTRRSRRPGGCSTSCARCRPRTTAASTGRRPPGLDSAG